MDKKSSQPIRSGHVEMMETKRRASSPTFGLKHVVSEGENIIQKWSFFSERVCNFSLGFPAIRPSNFFGPRSKVVLHIEDYTWAPVSGVFDKLCEAGVLSYLFYS